MSEIFDVRLYDWPLFSFRFISQGVGHLETRLVEMKSSNFDLFPLDINFENGKISDQSLFTWLQRRFIPKNRAYVEKILSSQNLQANDTEGIIRACKGLSLNDSYWVTPENFTGTFAQHNLYHNKFSDILALIAFTGHISQAGISSTSPEFTTGGMLPKAWRLIENEGVLLFKGGSTGAANAGLEPYSEFYACQIAKTMGLSFVNYDLEYWKGILASTCKLFTDINTSFVPIGYIVTRGGLPAVHKFLTAQGAEFVERFKDMLIFDALIYNTDRHFGNFGILRDNHSGKILSLAPIFDNGLSLFNYAMPDEIHDLQAYSLSRVPPYYNSTFEQIVSSYISDRQIQQLKKMTNFAFQRHPHFNWPEYRLKAIEDHLHKRTVQLLDLGNNPETAEESASHLNSATTSAARRPPK